MFTVIFGLDNNPGILVVVSFNVGMGWEFFENFYLQKKGFKFDDRVDSFANSLTDVLFVNIGAIVCAFITLGNFEAVFITSVIILAITLTLYEILRKITINNGNNNGKNMEKVQEKV